MKKLLALILSVALLLSVVPTATVGVTVSAETSGDFTYTVWDGEATITGYTGSETVVTIPTALEGYPVTAIGYEAFYEYTSLESITIPDSVTSIGDNAFYNCKSLENITLPDSLTEIGEYAFSGCDALMTVYYSGTKEQREAINIGNGNIDFTGVTWYYMFAGTREANSFLYVIHRDNTASVAKYTGSEADAVIPSAVDGYPVTSIGDWAFFHCTSLASITLPDGVITIGSGAFSACTSLLSITLPDGVTEIGRQAFSSCIALKSITIPDSVTEIGWEMFSYCTSLTGITLSDSVTTIGSGAFAGCTSLADIKLPDSVISIGGYAFRYCSSLTSIKLPDSVTSIGLDVFNYTAYYNNDANWEDHVLYIGNHLIKAKSNIIGEYTIKDGTKTIAHSAFMDCTSLTSITIPEGVTAIGEDAFFHCTSLESITIPDSMAAIGSGAFYNTAYYNNDANWKNDVLYIGNHLIKAKSAIVREYTIKRGAKTIAVSAFSYCTSLESIALPDSVTLIGQFAFSGCDALATVYYRGTEAQKQVIVIERGNEALTNATWIFAGESSVGDLNDDEIVNIADATVVFRAANGRIKLTDEQEAVADVNRDAIVNIADATMVFRYANGRINSFDLPTT